MSLSRALAAALDARPAHEGTLPRTVSVRDGTYHLALELSAASPVGVSFDRLGFELVAEGRPEHSIEGLKAWGDRLAARVTYLMEPLVVLEADPVGGEVNLRSQSPTPRGDRRSYYEVRLHRGGSLHMHRVAFDESTRARRDVPCQLSREALERLADDLVAAAPPA